MNGMKVIKYTAVVATAAAVLGLNSAQAMSVNWSSISTVGISLSDGLTPAPVGTTLELGYWSSIPAANATLATAQADFVVWATGAVGDGGTSAGEYADASVSPGAGFFSKQAGMLIIDGSVFAAIQGPITGNTQGDPWTFPATDTAPAPTFELGDVIAANVLIGGYNPNGSFNSADLSGANAVELTAVPEPSSIVLVVLGLFGGIGLIRRRRS